MAVVDGVMAQRSRRAILAGAAGAVGALATRSLGSPDPAEAAGAVQLGAPNTATAITSIRNTAPATAAVGLVGRSVNAGAKGLQGVAEGSNGIGVYGVANTGSSAMGVSGQASQGRGVQGLGVIGVLGSGTSRGVSGTSSANNGTGVFGAANTGNQSKGVWGRSVDGTGIYGDASGLLGIGVVGKGPYRGVSGESSSNFGVWAEGYTGIAARGTSVGVDSVGGAWGLYAQGPTYAAYLSGNVHIEGTLTGGGAALRIDHPSAPGSMILEHGYVDAPQRLSVYRGNAKLDTNGAVTVRLPRYVRAFNKDFSYQLTPLGGPAPGLHVAQRVNDAGTFRIAGGGAGQEVCWLVTGTRTDAWANAHPLRVERRKRREHQGMYLNPDVFGKSPSAAINQPPRPPVVSREQRPVKQFRNP